MERLLAARPEDGEAVCRFYEEVCAFQDTQEYGPVWHYGIYPDEQELKEHIERGELLLGFEEGRIAAAMVLNHHEDERYVDVPWTVREEPIYVLHLFAVHGDFQGRGIGKAALRLLLAAAREQGARAIHLDVVKGNLPAERLYERLGFCRREERDVWYEDTGDLRVVLYEYALETESG